MMLTKGRMMLLLPLLSLSLSALLPPFDGST